MRCQGSCVLTLSGITCNSQRKLERSMTFFRYINVIKSSVSKSMYKRSFYIVRAETWHHDYINQTFGNLNKYD